MWKTIAQALGLQIPDDHLAAIEPALDSLWKGTRQALDRDLSAIDPVITFRADVGGEP